MPNFWSKAGKFFTDSDSDETKDEDYQKAYEQMKNTESGLINLKNLLKGFNSTTQPVIKFIKELNDSIEKLFKDTPFKEYKSLISRTELILGDIDTLNKAVAKLYSKASEWDKIFEQAREKNKIREDKRKTFDHYQEKLQNLEKDPNKNKHKNKLSRNKEKYVKATNEYIQISEETFEIIGNSIKLSLDLANPVLNDLVLAQKEFYEKVSGKLVDFININTAQATPEKVEVEKKDYDATKFIKNKDLMTSAVANNRTTRIESILEKQSLSGKIGDYDKNVYISFNRTTNSFGKITEQIKLIFEQIADHPY